MYINMNPVFKTRHIIPLDLPVVSYQSKIGDDIIEKIGG